MKTYQIAVIGLGYVGLPLAVEFAKKHKVVGFDINQARVDELSKGHDSTLEVEDENLKDSLELNADKGLQLTTDLQEIKSCNVYIVTVPTPIDRFNRPDLTPLVKASETVGKVISKGDIVIYESTVYPGATEEDCIPVIEKTSGLQFNTDFYAGYSPERINPGDKVNTLLKIKKVTSGSTPQIAEEIDVLYNTILLNGTHKAPTIKVAEASKVIENAQRDLNISFVNELALIFDRLGVDTNDTIEAAGTKWNFIKYRPGLVGGHCIGVDPYYLAFKAESVGYHPEVIKAGRRVNNNMPAFVASKLIKLMVHKGLKILGSKVLLLGVTFKENCPDIRNTKVVNIVSELQEFGCDINIYDPWAEQEEVKMEYGIEIMPRQTDIYAQQYDAVILAVSHEQFMTLDMKRLLRNEQSVLFDIKGVLPRDLVDARL